MDLPWGEWTEGGFLPARWGSGALEESGLLNRIDSTKILTSHNIEVNMKATINWCQLSLSEKFSFCFFLFVCCIVVSA